MEQSLWTAVPAYLRRVNAALLKHTGKELPISAVPLSFGSWMGGDRDGNPNVTAKVSIVTGLCPAGALMAEVAAKTAACCPRCLAVKLLHACKVQSAAQAKARRCLYKARVFCWICRLLTAWPVWRGGWRRTCI